MNRLLKNSVSSVVRAQSSAKNIQTVKMPKLDQDHLVKRAGFQVGEQAPYAYHDRYQFPETYQPWNFNYSGNGLFLGVFLALTYGNLFYIIFHQKFLFLINGNTKFKVIVS